MIYKNHQENIYPKCLILFFMVCLMLCLFCFSSSASVPTHDKTTEIPEDLNENLAQLGKEMLGLRLENKEILAENQKLNNRLFHYKETIEENKGLKVKIGKIKKELSKYENEKNPFYKENMQLKKELEKAQKLNADFDLKNKTLDASLKDLEKVLKDKNNIEVSLQNAEADNARLKKENQDLADSLNKTIQENNLKQSALYSELGSVYIKLRSYELAILAYEESLKLNPKEGDNYYNLGILYNHTHRDKKKSVKYLKEYLLFGPDDKTRKEVEYLIDMMSQE